MIQMTQNELLSKLESFDNYPDPTHKYGLTENDLNRIESEPEKYLEFIMYLLSRSFYNSGSNYEFENEDAVDSKIAARRLNHILNNYVIVV